jgi:hypothetical protein
MSISAISASTPVAAFTPVNSANIIPTLNPSLNPTLAPSITPPANTPTSAQTLNPALTETTIAQTYGFAPSLIVPVSQPIIYQALSANPDAVAAVKTVSLVPRSGEYPGQLFDSLA